MSELDKTTVFNRQGGCKHEKTTQKNPVSADHVLVDPSTETVEDSSINTQSSGSGQ